VAPLAYQGKVMCEGRALIELAGLGDAAAGEWRDSESYMMGGRIFHLRRRLSAREARGMTIRDIRGTREARLRAEALGGRLKVVPPFVLREELGPR
jgi:hypothetical protein